MPERAHHFRISQASALVLALMGCGAPPEPAANAPIGPAPATSDVVANDTPGGACMSSFNSEMGEQNLQPVFGGNGFQVWATPGALNCPISIEEGVTTPVTCEVSGPSEVRYATQEVVYFHIAAGQSASLVVGDVANGAQVCTINEAIVADAVP